MVKLLRQIIKYKYEKIYETNARNNRFFYQDFYVAYSLALIWLVKNMGYKADMDEIKFKNGLWLKYTTLSLRESLNSHDKGDKEYNNLVQDLYLKKRKIIDEDFQRMIAEDLHIINLFLKLNGELLFLTTPGKCVDIGLNVTVGPGLSPTSPSGFSSSDLPSPT